MCYFDFDFLFLFFLLLSELSHVYLIPLIKLSIWLELIEAHLKTFMAKSALTPFILEHYLKLSEKLHLITNILIDIIKLK